MAETAPATVYVNQSSAKPTRKVGAGALAGALSIVIVWGIESFFHTIIPATVASAFTVILTFLTSYFVRDAE